jgi:AcrR family transcriptional regulator
VRSKRTLKPKAGAEAGRLTQDRLVQAALKTLTQKGFAGATARQIAAEAKANQALIFYHFGSVDRLLIAALEATSTARLQRYRRALAPVRTLAQLVDVMARLYREDVVSGHISAVQEMVAGAASVPSLRREVLERMAPWVGFAREVLERLLSGSIAEKLIPIDDLAFAAVAFYFGIETITNLAADRSRVDAFFKMGRQLAPIADELLRSASWVGESA